jgi:hypothetical protein
VPERSRTEACSLATSFVTCALGAVLESFGVLMPEAERTIARGGGLWEANSVSKALSGHWCHTPPQEQHTQAVPRKVYRQLRVGDCVGQVAEVKRLVGHVVLGGGRSEAD